MVRWSSGPVVQCNAKDGKGNTSSFTPESRESGLGKKKDILRRVIDKLEVAVEGKGTK